MKLLQRIGFQFQGWPIGTKRIALIAPFMAAAMVVAAWAVHERNAANLQEKLTQRAQSLHTQIMADRKYYASVIVPRVVELGGSLGPDYRQVPGRFPLPATFVHEVAELAAEARAGYAAKLISPWAINKDKGLKDQFHREAFAYLTEHPTGQFFRADTIEGRAVMGVLMADHASAQSCVDCHNTHPLSPKRDFKLGDLMGGLEIVTPIGQYVLESRRDLALTVAGGVGLCLMVSGIVALGARLTVTRPLARLAGAMRLVIGTGGSSTHGLAALTTGAVSVPSGDEVEQLTVAFKQLQAIIVTQQEELRETNAALERRVVERTQALQAAEEQLRQSQKMEAVGQLAGGIAHDFNNMLTVITGYSELLLHSLQADDPQRSHVEQIKQSGERAATLTGQLLAFSRKQVLQPKVLNLNAVVTNMDRMLQRLIGEDIELHTVLSPGLGHVRADPGQLEQVILNLVVNAHDAISEGGRLTIETANVELDEVYARRHVAVQPGPYVMLAVSDTGCGMDAETQARIFEPFFTTKGKGKGTGLGLSTVYGIVKQSGGSIGVYSEPGRGATFKIYLPRVEEAVETGEPDAPPTELSRGSETVLLVEDAEDVRTLASTVLQMNGYTVLEASNGDMAIAICEQHKSPIHLLVTDVVMPGMSGRELAERLASSRPNMKRLYTSGYTDDAVVRHGVVEADVAFLQKPFTPDALARKVREVLEQ